MIVSIKSASIDDEKLSQIIHLLTFYVQLQALALVLSDNIGSCAKIISGILSLNFLNHLHQKLTNLSITQGSNLKCQTISRNYDSPGLVLKNFSVLEHHQKSEFS